MHNFNRQTNYRQTLHSCSDNFDHAFLAAYHNDQTLTIVQYVAVLSAAGLSHNWYVPNGCLSWSCRSWWWSFVRDFVKNRYWYTRIEKCSLLLIKLKRLIFFVHRSLILIFMVILDFWLFWFFKKLNNYICFFIQSWRDLNWERNSNVA